jgi:transcription initiation factor IIE alpha subunit|tara:strand:- start:246 stop:464 length:219 start_codon:yes stop_codon:yes gene_type:complete
MTPEIYQPQIGDIVQYVGRSEKIDGAIGVVVKRETVTNFKRASYFYKIQFPNAIVTLRPQHFKVIKRINKKI